MHPVGEHDPQSTWAEVVLDAFAAAGIRHLVVSPGSRSTPFVLAALRHLDLTCESVIDERDAGFVALGRAKVEGRPTLLLCTSGSALAHFYPAVLEASESLTPLVVLSADRPWALQGCGAPQTIDQLKFFGTSARWFAELGAADLRPAALRAARRTAARAVHESRYPRPGPVHVNVRAEKPLTRSAASRPEHIAAAKQARAIASEPVVCPRRPRLLPGADTVDDVAARIRSSPDGILVTGPGPVEQGHARPHLFELARRSGFAVYAEATSQFRFAGADRREVSVCDALGVLLRSPRFRERWRPQWVLQVGRPPIAGALATWLDSRPRCDHVVISPEWYDPTSSGTEMLVGDVHATLAALVERLPPSRARPSCTEQLMGAEAAMWRAIDVLVTDHPGLSEAAVARTVVSGLPAEGVLVVGNSLPVRHLDTWVRGLDVSLRVVSQRGACGIDGLVAAASGAARVGGKPAALLLGDVSLLHNLGGLGCVRGMTDPLVIVVIQNDGGRIFEQLPLAQSVEREQLTYWTTPHGLAFRHVAEFYGIPYARVTDLESLRSRFEEGLRTEGATLIEAVVEPQDASELDRRLTDLAARVAASWPGRTP